MNNPEEKNYAAIERLEALLAEARANGPTRGEAGMLREVGLEMAIAVREVGAMLVNVGWEQTYPSNRPAEREPAG